jgi:hypothetical protein
MAVSALKLKAPFSRLTTPPWVRASKRWCVEAQSAEEARELPAAGAGYRCEIGECVNLEVERVEE